MFWSPVRQGDITWNFEKFLIDRKGRARYRFNPRNWANGTVVEPYIEKLLEETETSGLSDGPIISQNNSDVRAKDEGITLANNFAKFFQVLTGATKIT